VLERCFASSEPTSADCRNLDHLFAPAMAHQGERAVDARSVRISDGCALCERRGKLAKQTAYRNSGPRLKGCVVGLMHWGHWDSPRMSFRFNFIASDLARSLLFLSVHCAWEKIHDERGSLEVRYRRRPTIDPFAETAKVCVGVPSYSIFTPQVGHHRIDLATLHIFAAEETCNEKQFLQTVQSTKNSQNMFRCGHAQGEFLTLAIFCLSSASPPEPLILH
jgi:hypothetical protein